MPSLDEGVYPLEDMERFYIYHGGTNLLFWDRPMDGEEDRCYTYSSGDYPARYTRNANDSKASLEVIEVTALSGQKVIQMASSETGKTWVD